MTRKDKLLTKLADHKQDKNWTIDEAQTLLFRMGFTMKKSAGSSHRAYAAPHYDGVIVLAPHGNKILPVYVKMLRSELL